MLWPAITAESISRLVLHDETGFGRDDDAFAFSRERPADERLVAERAVDVRGIEVVDAEIEGSMNHVDRRRFIDRIVPIAPAESHAAQTDGVDRLRRAIQAASLHGLTISICLRTRRGSRSAPRNRPSHTDMIHAQRRSP